jgi:hypothetical protein
MLRNMSSAFIEMRCQWELGDATVHLATGIRSSNKYINNARLD